MWVQLPRFRSALAQRRRVRNRHLQTLTPTPHVYRQKLTWTLAGTPVTSPVMHRHTETHRNVSPTWPVEGAARFQQRATRFPSLLSGSRVPPITHGCPKLGLCIQTWNLRWGNESQPHPGERSTGLLSGTYQTLLGFILYYIRNPCNPDTPTRL